MLQEGLLRGKVENGLFETEESLISPAIFEHGRDAIRPRAGGYPVAGLYESWQLDGDRTKTTFRIVTCPANTNDRKDS